MVPILRSCGSGAENFFLFGLTAEEVDALKARGYPGIPVLSTGRSSDLIASGHFSQGDTNLFRPFDSLLHQDQYMLQITSYVECQDRASQAYQDRENWTRMSILNVARMGSSPLIVRFGNIVRKSGR